ncbi:MAG: methyltransferase family protein [Nitrospiraceae bacterium]
MSDKDISRPVAPPPIIYLVCVLVGFGLDQLSPQPLLAQTVQYTVGFAIIAVSFLLFGLALREFANSKTSVNHHTPTTAIVSTGPFGYSRNPIYVSMTMLMVGIATVVDSVWILVMAVPAVVITHYFVILREEVYLERKFGDEYLSYKSTVRRWV